MTAETYQEEYRPIRFEEFDLCDPVRRGIEDAGFVECTPIQASTLPLALAGSDVAGQAQTGTGKTAAYLIATFNRLLIDQEPGRSERRAGDPRALVVAPTRELVIQIKEEADLLGRHCDLTIHAVYGGVDYVGQLERLRDGVDVLIGTPGRLIDYFRQKAYSLSSTPILVIDEADRMFDMGFIDDIRYLVRRMPDPSKRQSFLYSATLSHRVLELAYEHMNRVERIAVSEDRVTADNIAQVVYHVGQEDKLSLLLGLLQSESPSRALIFVNTRIIAAQLADWLVGEGFPAGALAGDMDQRKRLRLLNNFKEGKISILVATDVASRGLHIEQVSHVFNYDLPQDPEDYVHRIGRTARAGASGRAVSLACEKYVYSLEAIEEFIDSKLPHEFADESMMVKPKFRRLSRNGDGRRGARRDPRESDKPRSGKARPRRPEPARAAAEKPSGDESATDPDTKKRRRRPRRRRRKPTAGAGASAD